MSETIDLVLADNDTAILCYEPYINRIMDELGLEYNIKFERDDLVNVDYYIREMPQDAVIYAHSSISYNNSFFSMALKVSQQRPDLRFILRMRDAIHPSDFKDIASFEAYQELAEHLPHPSRPISVTSMDWDYFFITDARVDEEGYFKHYMSELKQMKGL